MTHSKGETTSNESRDVGKREYIKGQAGIKRSCYSLSLLLKNRNSEVRHSLRNGPAFLMPIR